MAESTEEKPKLEVKQDWYQTESLIVITLLVKNLTEDCLEVNFTDNKVTVKISKPDFQNCDLCFNLSHKVVPSQCSYKLSPSKVEIKLKKAEGIRWEKLEGTGVEDAVKQIKLDPLPQGDKPPSYPTSKKGKDWSALEKEIKEQEALEKPEGEEAVNKLFQEIYGKGSDEIKRAMNKSYMESGGTVLSTNWEEVSKEKVQVKPPNGMEFKKWND